MRIVLSTGIGRLHLVQSAISIANAGVDVRLITGWVPRNPDGMLVRVASKIVRLDLSARMRKLVVKAANVKVLSCDMSEFIAHILRIVASRIGFGVDCVACFAWKVFGWQCKRYLHDAEVFHVRSGAGQGGAIRMARRRGMKVVVDHSIAHPAFMAENIEGFSKDSKFWRQVLKDCEEADLVLVNSFFVRDTFVDRGFDPGKIKVVYLGEREDFFGLRQQSKKKLGGGASRRLKLLFTGGFGSRKGAEYILEACRILQQRGVDFEMDVVGAYDSAKELIAQYERFCLPIIFHGPKPQDELKSFLAAGDIYVFPSLAEGCAQSGMEAMAAGMCVVGTHESGFPITDGKDGFIVPSKDTKAIADRVEWLNFHRDEIDRVGLNAEKLIRENFTWYKYAENVKMLYMELVARDA